MQIISDNKRIMQIPHSTESEFRLYVKRSGMRMNETKLRIFNLLLTADRPLSIKDMVTAIPEVHYVSIYRTVDSLRKAGVISLVPQGFKNLFELSDIFSPHHHHISCEKCGRLSAINDSEIEQSIEALSKQAGYTPTKHHLELYGLCPACS